MPALQAQLKIAPLTGLDLVHRAGELWRQRHGHENQAILPKRGTAYRVLRLLPGEMGGLARRNLREWELVFQHRPGSGNTHARLCNSVFYREDESTLQSGLCLRISSTAVENP